MWYDLAHSYFAMNSQGVQDYVYTCFKNDFRSYGSKHLGMRGWHLFKASVSFVLQTGLNWGQTTTVPDFEASLSNHLQSMTSLNQDNHRTIAAH